MKLNLTNIGPLKTAELDLSKKLIVFTGLNNSGKTYAAYIIYGLYSLLRNNLEIFYFIDSGRSEKLIEDSSVEIDLLDYLEITHDSFIDYMQTTLSKNLYKVFDTPHDFFQNSEIHIINEPSSLFNSMIVSKAYKATLRISENVILNMEKSNDSSILKVQMILEPGSAPEHDFVRFALNYEIYNLICSTYFERVFTLPAERNAINIFFKQLSVEKNELLERIIHSRKDKNLNSDFKKPFGYPLPIKDSLDIAERLAQLKKEKSDFEYLALELEKNILKGKIKVSENGEVQYSPNKSPIKNLDIHLTASMVKSLSNLVFYFRHLAQKGDFIIFDEPELNLHPDNQILIARFLARVVNEGFKVLISTHSDYIIREFNALIMMNYNKEKVRDLMSEHKYDESSLLDYNLIGAYMFKGNTCQLLPIDELGFSVTSIDEAITKQSNITEQIYSTLFE
ncbi:MAG: AAA family ATPase [Cytophagales bacterium]